MADYGINLDLGDYVGTVVATQLVELGQNRTPALKVRVDVEGEVVEPVVWITPKALGMARQALKAIGFDIDGRNIEELDENPKALAGNPCPVRVVEDDYGGKLRKKAEIITSTAARIAKPRMDAITRALRDAASDETKAKNAASPPPAAPATPPAAAAPAPRRPAWGDDAPPQTGPLTPEQRAALRDDAFKGESDIPF